MIVAFFPHSSANVLCGFYTTHSIHHTPSGNSPGPQAFPFNLSVGKPIICHWHEARNIWGEAAVSSIALWINGLPGETGLGSGGCLTSGGSGGPPGGAVAVEFVLSVPSPPSAASCLWGCWAWRSWASSMVMAVWVAAAASPSGKPDGADTGGDGGLGIGGVRGTPVGAGGWGGLAGRGWGGGSAGSVGARALESCCNVSWLTFVLTDWTNCAMLPALLGWPRKFSRTASCSCVSWEFGPFGSVKEGSKMC